MLLLSRAVRSRSSSSELAAALRLVVRTPGQPYRTLQHQRQQQQQYFATSVKRQLAHYSSLQHRMDNSNNSGGGAVAASDDQTRFADVPVPERCYADFCLVPVGTANVSVAEEVAEVQRLLKASGLTYTMHSAGTTLEGPWDKVFRVIGQAHTVVHQKGVLRVQTSMRVGTRTDKSQTAKDKVQRVEDILASGK